MSWNNQGSGGGGGGPRGQWPPNIEEILRRSQDKVKRILPGGFGSGGAAVERGEPIDR